MRILVTGATGFIGRALVGRLLDLGEQVIASVRAYDILIPEEVRQIETGTFSGQVTWPEKLSEVDTIIHLAARVHVMNESLQTPLQAFRDVNVEGTLSIASQAAEAGVKRFIFISSIKANGESTIGRKAFIETDQFVPLEPYALSKYEAEKGLFKLAKETGMEVVIIRPPLVYGPGVKANFLSLMKLVNRGIPLPFGKLENKRSFIALDNLVSFIIHCIEHPKAANEVFIISDGEDVSTTELLRKVAKSLGKKPWFIPVPISLMKFMVQLVGKTSLSDRLFGSLQVDSSKARDLLGWKPITTMDEQLKKTADAFLK